MNLRRIVALGMAVAALMSWMELSPIQAADSIIVVAVDMQRTVKLNDRFLAPGEQLVVAVELENHSYVMGVDCDLSHYEFSLTQKQPSTPLFTFDTPATLPISSTSSMVSGTFTLTAQHLGNAVFNLDTTAFYTCEGGLDTKAMSTGPIAPVYIWTEEHHTYLPLVVIPQRIVEKPQRIR
ncbi:MAG: hypothetical protein GVY30_07450 [Chloroflexi bacterium]|nr:hypothetical protein [Chloroflexota bacterium]